MPGREKPSSSNNVGSGITIKAKDQMLEQKRSSSNNRKKQKGSRHSPTAPSSKSKAKAPSPGTYKVNRYSHG